MGQGFTKTRTRPGPGSGFFLKNPNPTLFLIGSGKIRPIRVGPDRVPADRVKIDIPTWWFYSCGEIDILWEHRRLFGCKNFITQFPSLNFHHSSLNFFHSFDTITHFPSLNIFHTICGPHIYHSVQFFFFSTQTHRTQ